MSNAVVVRSCESQINFGKQKNYLFLTVFFLIFTNFQFSIRLPTHLQLVAVEDFLVRPLYLDLRDQAVRGCQN